MDLLGPLVVQVLCSLTVRDSADARSVQAAVVVVLVVEGEVR
ncbi:hypothetical protein [Pasteuria penetrans]|nr:hypothetical protein [Pasteuria penetrans]